MSAQVHKAKQEHAPAPQDEVVVEPVKRDPAKDQEIDDLLDEIDEVLEVNAEEFVAAFVQKGGQHHGGFSPHKGGQCNVGSWTTFDTAPSVRSRSDLLADLDLT